MCGFWAGNAVFGGMAGVLGHVKKCVKRNFWGVFGGLGVVFSH